MVVRILLIVLVSVYVSCVVYEGSVQSCSTGFHGFTASTRLSASRSSVVVLNISLMFTWSWRAKDFSTCCLIGNVFTHLASSLSSRSVCKASDSVPLSQSPARPWPVCRTVCLFTPQLMMVPNFTALWQEADYVWNDLHLQLWWQSLQCSWTSSLGRSADGPQTARRVIRPFETVAEDAFVWSARQKRTVNHKS